MTIREDDRAALVGIADELDAGNKEQTARYRKRIRAWKNAMKNGATAAECAEVSRVSAVTVRQLIRQSK